MISQMAKSKKDIIRRKAETQADQIMEEAERRRWNIYPSGELKLEFRFPESLSKIVTAASLAYHGMLGSVKWMFLEDVDLASLVLCATKCVDIRNVSNIINILDNIRCKYLEITRQTLSSEETYALVRAMESRVEVVTMGFGGGVSLDCKTLTQFSEQGKCREFVCWVENADRSWKEVSSWAQRRIEWYVFEDNRGLYYHSLENRLMSESDSE